MDCETRCAGVPVFFCIVCGSCVLAVGCAPDGAMAAVDLIVEREGEGEGARKMGDGKQGDVGKCQTMERYGEGGVVCGSL